MRVLLEGWRLCLSKNYGGIESYWKQLVPALIRANEPDLNFTLLSAFLNPRKIPRMDSFRNSRVKIRHWWSSPAFLFQLGKYGLPLEWLGGRHDLVHTCEPYWPLSGKGRLVVTCHDLMYHHYPQFLDPQTVNRLEQGTESCAERATWWICDSEYTRNDLVKEFGVAHGRTSVAPIGVASSFFAAGQKEFKEAEEPYFLFVGSIEPKKNLPGLMTAFAEAVDKGCPARLKIAGRVAWGSEELSVALQKNPVLKDRVDFLGFVPQAELPQLLAQSLALVLPSFYEGFGMPVVEGMAAGTPVLCSNRGALPETSGGAAKLFDPMDSSFLAEHLCELSANPTLRDKMRSAGLKHASSFTWENCASSTLAAYRQAMSVSK
ncbi:MAG TPA: glycosyltransferase family 1 protein [Planctomycetota bacterium]|nr:glycosyltransferase family 1 protein [Planctomycetota bacterium]